MYFAFKQSNINCFIFRFEWHSQEPHFFSDGNSPGPIGPPPSAASPLTVSPQLSDQVKTEDWRSVGPIGGERPMGPIGGERAQRRAPGPIPAPPISVANDYSPAFWNIATGR